MRYGSRVDAHTFFLLFITRRILYGVIVTERPLVVYRSGCEGVTRMGPRAR